MSDQNEVSQFIRKSLDGIREGLKRGEVLITDVDFDIAVAKKAEGSGKIDVSVLGMGAERKPQRYRV